MPRTARTVAVGQPHHVTQRGNRGQEVFFSAEDYQQYLVSLGEEATARGLKVWAYCLMPNHVHLIVVPETPEALARTLQAVHSSHAQRINNRHGWQGHLWQGRYFSCVLGEVHLGEAVRYVERNPVRAGMVQQATDHPWSSAGPHCGYRRDPALSADLPLLALIPNWRAWLQTRESEEAVERLRRCTERGRTYA